MFFVVSKLVAPLLSPLPLVFVGALGVALFGCRGRARRVLLGLLAILWLCSAGVVVDRALARQEAAFPPLALDGVPAADAVVVLGGMTERRPPHALTDRVEFNDTADRLLEGARLVRAGVAPRLVLSGGASDLAGRTPPESPLLADWLVAAGLLARDQIAVEAESRSTSENAERTAALAREFGWRRVILVTSALHMRRAEACFRRAGLEVVAYPADYLGERIELSLADFFPSEQSLYVMRRLLREWIGLAAYRLTGRI